MRRVLSPALLLALALPLAAGCAKKASSEKIEVGPEKAEAAPAASEDTVCKEHGVLEALCTQCNPALAVEPTTGETHLRHHVSPTGFYRGKKVLKTKGE